MSRSRIVSPSPTSTVVSGPFVPGARPLPLTSPDWNGTSPTSLMGIAIPGMSSIPAIFFMAGMSAFGIAFFAAGMSAMAGDFRRPASNASPDSRNQSLMSSTSSRSYDAIGDASSTTNAPNSPFPYWTPTCE